MSTPNDPFAPPGDGGQQPEQPGHGSQPPAYGSPTTPGQPPAYGGQPPAYGSQPPAYSGQPPAYSGQPPAYGGQPAAYGPPPAYAGGPMYPKNSLGVWAIVLAGVAFFCAGPLASIPGVILGHMALRANRAGEANNFGLSMAGTVISWVVTIGYVALLLWLFAFGGWASYMNLIDEATRVG